MYDSSIVEAQKKFPFTNLHYAKFLGPYPLVRHMEIDLAMLDAGGNALPGEIRIDFTSDTTAPQREAVMAELKKLPDYAAVVYDGNITITANSGIVNYDMVKQTLGALLSAAVIKTDDVMATAQFVGAAPSKPELPFLN